MSGEAMRYQAVAGLERSPMPDGCAVYDRTRREIHYLNPMAAAILELCGAGQDGETIARAMQTVFDLPSAPSADVENCIAVLAEKGLIEAKPPQC